MSSKTLEIYAERARTMADPTLASGRLIATKSAERRILQDVLEKLDVGPEDTVLDIGSGIGVLAIPLSFIAETVTCIDHPQVLARLRARAPEQPIRYAAGNFLDIEFADRQFSRIVVYDVLHYLTDMTEVHHFVDKAVSLLAPMGKLLIGDVRNDSLLERIERSEDGQRYMATWGRAKWLAADEQSAAEQSLPRDTDLVTLGDAELLAIVARQRAAGNHAWLLPQGRDLPMWHQREDVLIQRLEPGPARDLVVARLSNGEIVMLSIREAQETDAELYYRWSQDPAVRSASIRRETFGLEAHCAWFAEKLARRDRVRMYVLERAAVDPIGQIRYEKVVPGEPLWTGGPPAPATDVPTAEISISMIERVRGMRLATALIDRTLPRVRDELGVRRVVALVRADNDGSAKAFQRTGFVPAGETERLGVWLLRFAREVPAE